MFPSLAVKRWGVFMACSRNRRIGKSSRRHIAAALSMALLLAGVELPFSVGHADVTTSGLNTTVNVVGNNFNITGGTRPNNGANLFHSFGDFSLTTPQSAVFLN